MFSQLCLLWFQSESSVFEAQLFGLIGNTFYCKNTTNILCHAADDDGRSDFFGVSIYATCMTTLTTRLGAWSGTRLRSRLISWSSIVCVIPDNQSSKSYARAVKPVKIKLITVAKGNSKGAELVAGSSCPD